MQRKINKRKLVVLLLGCMCVNHSASSFAGAVELQLGSVQTNLVLGHGFQAELIVSNIPGMRIKEVNIGVAPVGSEPQREVVRKVLALSVELPSKLDNYKIRGVSNYGVWPGISCITETTNGPSEGCADLIFQSPGIYDVRFYVNHHLTSSVARVHVVAPEGENRKAWEHLPVGAYLEVMGLYSGYEHPEHSYARLANNGEELAAFMQTYGESYYGRAMSTNLFRLYLAKSRKSPPPEWLNKCYEASLMSGGKGGIMKGLYEQRFNVRTTEYGRVFFKKESGLELEKRK